MSALLKPTFFVYKNKNTIWKTIQIVVSLTLRGTIMRTKVHFSILLGAITVLSSCSNYGYISENDVYMQAPTEINLEENENDLTSFNAFKAREKGAFRDEYRDPRVNERVRMNQFMIMSSYMPFGMGYGPYMSPYGMYNNGPIGFHGMAMYGFGYGNYTVGHHGIYDGFYNHYGFGYNPYGYGYNPYGYGYGNYAYGYNPYYYGGGYYNGINDNPNTPTVSQPVHYGNRTPLTSSSNRSSSYQKTSYKQPIEAPTSSYDVNDQSLGTSRREVQKKYTGTNTYNNNGKPNNSNYSNSQSGYDSNSGAAHQRTATQNYTPNASARRSGAVQSQRSVYDGESSRSINTSPSNRSTPSQARPQVRGSFSTGGSIGIGGSVGGSTRNTSSPSTNGSSGTPNSSSGRR